MVVVTYELSTCIFSIVEGYNRSGTSYEKKGAGVKSEKVYQAKLADDKSKKNCAIKIDSRRAELKVDDDKTEGGYEVRGATTRKENHCVERPEVAEKVGARVSKPEE